jgi:hypothetical protein
VAIEADFLVVPAFLADIFDCSHGISENTQEYQDGYVSSNLHLSNLSSF